MQKQRRHHPRIKRRLTQSARVTAGDRGKIKLFPDKGHDQPRQMVLRHIVLHARRQKLRLINLPAPKIFAHSHAKNQTHSNLTSDYSDRLLGTLSRWSRVWRLQAWVRSPRPRRRGHRPHPMRGLPSMAGRVWMNGGANAARITWGVSLRSRPRSAV